MTDFAFLPDFPLPMSTLALFGVLVLAGLAGGALARKISLPTITGYTLVGLALGRSGLDLFTTELLVQARVFADISLGLILFDLGRRLDFKWLRNDRFLFAAGASESLLSFVFIFVTLDYFGIPKLFAAATAAIGISTSPAVVMLLAQEQRAEGQVTERALTLVAVNSVVAFITVTMLLSALHYEYQASPLTMVLHPLYLLAGSMLLGALAWHAALRLGRRLGKQSERQFIMLVAMVVLTVGVASALKLSVLLALLVFGVLVKNRDPQHDFIPAEVGGPGHLFFIVLFVVTGMQLNAKYLLIGGILGLAYVAVRGAGKILGVMPWAMLSGLNRKSALLLGLALMPMAEFEFVMVQYLRSVYPDFHPEALAIVISAVLILELIGPLIVLYALRQSGETHVRGGS